MIEKKLPPPVINGFEGIHRFWNGKMEKYLAKIKPGELYVTKNKSELIATVLGSCISACIYDRGAGIGGMNHFMLPQTGNDHCARGKIFDPFSKQARYGNWAMENLINTLLNHGALRRNLEVKLFGGGQVVATVTFTSVGDDNIDFAKKYIFDEGLKLISTDLGGKFPRKVLFDPFTGKASIKKLRTVANDTIVNTEKKYFNQINKDDESGDVELF